MAPPKRKSTGRVTPKGTKPGQVTAMAKEAPHHDSSIAQSSRYTPPTPKEYYESPSWVPILMFTFLGLGAISIILRYVVPAFENTNTPVLIGLVCMLAGLFTATKWK
ncbi:MAG: cell division protein CrgA [Actinomycetota bacterium]|nr:cell division protein CrgA [Actinomycetota bacterium]